MFLARASAATSAQENVRWVDLLRHRKLWGLLLGKLFSDAAYYFVLFWLPKYLNDVQELNIKEIGAWAWIPYAALGVGSFVGGGISSYLMRRNVSLDRSRKISLAIAAAMLPFCMLIPIVPLPFVIVFFSMAFCGHQFF
jgi:ACS family hexuronate transporter-like MFS transporter